LGTTFLLSILQEIEGKETYPVSLVLVKEHFPVYVIEKLNICPSSSMVEQLADNQ
jgi:hypothetical protein